MAGIALAMAAGGLASCGQKKAKGPKPMFSSKDTTAVLRLAEGYLDHVMNREYDKAMGMLHDILADSVRDLSPERDSAIREQQRVFPVLAYKRTGMRFTTPRSVSVTYQVEFFEREPGSKIPNTYVITFEPQRIDGKWYLELSERSHSR